MCSGRRKSAPAERSKSVGALRKENAAEGGVLEEIEQIMVEKEILLGKAAQAGLTPNRERLDKLFSQIDLIRL